MEEFTEKSKGKGPADASRLSSHRLKSRIDILKKLDKHQLFSLILIFFVLLTMPLVVVSIGQQPYFFSEAQTVTTSPITPPNQGKAGDANGDGIVDGIDYVIWLIHYNQHVSNASNGDFDGNGIVDGIDYVIWLNNYGTKSQPTPTVVQVPTSTPKPSPAPCVDSDGGKDYWNYGTVTLINGTQSADYCSGANNLNEAYCTSSGTSAYSIYYCPAGCVSGACRPACYDSDNGLNYNTQGTATGADSMQYTDYCGSDGKTLYEGYCVNPDNATYQTHTCPNSCSSGVCTNN